MGLFGGGKSAGFQSSSQKNVLLRSVTAFLDSQKWRYQTDNAKCICHFGMNLNCKVTNCQVLVQTQDDCIQAFAVCPMKASEANRLRVAEYISRANYGLKIGCFEMDFRDGEVRYHTILPCSAGTPQMADVGKVVALSFLMLDRFGDGLMNAMMGVGDPAADVAAAQAKQ